jgi:hypothetical protein
MSALDSATKVAVSFDPCFAYIADKNSERARKLVTTFVLGHHNGAPGTLADQRCGHGFFHGASILVALLFCDLSTIERKVIGFATSSTRFMGTFRTSKDRLGTAPDIHIRDNRCLKE